jgi:glycosyltransferase involved in cell wall biosynthesis
VIQGQKVAVVLPAYNASSTLRKTIEEIERDLIDDIIIVDDASTDDTIEVARSLGLDPIVHPLNQGYGGNQKTCYQAALERGADIVVMIHPDYQYSPKLSVPIASMIACGEYDLVLGSRILAQNAVRRGMPRYKFFSNRVLTLVENTLVRAKLSEYHTGLRAYSRRVLESIPLDRNSNDFVFDNQVILQALMLGARVGEVSCPTRYAADSSSISFKRSVTYGVGVTRCALQYRLHRWKIRRAHFLDFPARFEPRAS